jgi:hypothetical protein
MLLRVDIRNYAARAQDLSDWLNTWEALRFDPAFVLDITPDTLKLALLNPFEMIRAYKAEGKITYTKVGAKELEESGVLRVLAPDINPEPYQELQQLLFTTAPIVTTEYFTARSLASIKDEKLFNGLYNELYGGLYYDFTGIPGNSKEGTDLDNLLDRLGVGSVKGKVTADQLFQDRKSDRKRVAVFRSNVAAKRPRRIDFLPILASDAFESPRIFTITFDLKRANLDIGVHPIMNLLKTLRDFDASEAIWTQRNGLLGYALYNGKGVRQEKAPDDVVKDHAVAEPFYGELQAPISCMRCHEKRGHKGWQPVKNDAQELLKFRRGQLPLIPTGDLNFEDQGDALDQIRTLFSGNAEAFLGGARDAYTTYVWRATGSWKTSKKNNNDVVELSSGKLVDIWDRYFYGDVTAVDALWDAGFDIPEVNTAALVLDKLIQVPPGGAEDIRIAQLRQGGTIGRYEFDLVRRIVSTRVHKTLKEHPKLLEAITL